MEFATTRPVILQVLPALESGGIEQGTIEMAAAITQAGGTALVASAGGRLIPRLRYVGATPVHLDLRPKNPISILRNALRLGQIIREHSVSLVHARSRAPAWAAASACRRTGVPLVTTWHGVYGNNIPGKRRYNAVMASGQRVIAVSEYIAQRLRTEYRVGDDRLRLIPRGADITRFDPYGVRGNRVQNLLDQWDLPEHAAIIVLPGRITPWKGQMLLLDALAQMERTGGCGRDWICVFVGDAKERDKHTQALVDRTRREGLRERVRFTGHCADMPAVMMLADVVVVPSLRPEPFGRVVVEAQAMGRPVVVAAHGAALETVEDGVTGFTFPPGDVTALAEAVCTALCMTPEQHALMATHARENVMAHYTSHGMQYATLSVYDELLHTHMAETFLYNTGLVAADHDLEQQQAS
ncbi:glycosyltransferase family 4 protein [Gluconacetobacter entanii]|uniref:Glycosyl transferase n=1 Tax=Gluconacetobacter entanii TaxID=108528 RepID=A0A318PVU7_9PROT|nr:glycosyltransferase family 4 protein [Gluconacetobacter entanii]PYD63298.1 glycosyl transferase [Gluconacetobacter entanii]